MSRQTSTQNTRRVQRNSTICKDDQSLTRSPKPTPWKEPATTTQGVQVQLSPPPQIQVDLGKRGSSTNKALHHSRRRLQLEKKERKLYPGGRWTPHHNEREENYHLHHQYPNRKEKYFTSYPFFSSLSQSPLPSHFPSSPHMYPFPTTDSHHLPHSLPHPLPPFPSSPHSPFPFSPPSPFPLPIPTTFPLPTTLHLRLPSHP